MAGTIRCAVYVHPQRAAPTVLPTACPGGRLADGSDGQRYCSRGGLFDEVLHCPYVVAYTSLSDATRRVSLQSLSRQLSEQMRTVGDCRVVCLLAKPVDKAGA